MGTGRHACTLMHWDTQTDRRMDTDTTSNIMHPTDEYDTTVTNM